MVVDAGGFVPSNCGLTAPIRKGARREHHKTLHSSCAEHQSMPSRRDVLALCTGSFAAVTGCGSRAGTETESPTDREPTTGSTTSRQTLTPTPGPATGVTVDDAAATWERVLEPTLRAGPVHVGGTVVAVYGPTVYGFDAATGETAWRVDSRVEIGEGWRAGASLWAHDAVAYVLVGENRGLSVRDAVVVAVDPADGTERWRRETGITGVHALVGFGADSLVVGTSDDFIQAERRHEAFALALGDGSRRWTGQAGDAFGGGVGAGVACVRATSAVDCFDLETGDHRFRYTPPGGEESEMDGGGEVQAVAIGRGRLFVPGAPRNFGAADRTFAALSASDGSVAWELTGQAVSSARYRDDLYLGGERVERYSPDGTRRWSYDAGGHVTDVPFGEGALYTNPGSRIVAVARDSGEERWSTGTTDLAAPVGVAGDAVVSADRRARTVIAHDVADGTEQWRATVDGEEPLSAVPAVGSGAAYLATSEGAMVRVEA